jgi:hypothetical protein
MIMYVKIREEIKIILNFWVACFHTIQNICLPIYLKHRGKSMQYYNFVCCFVWL